MNTTNSKRNNCFKSLLFILAIILVSFNSSAQESDAAGQFVLNKFRVVNITESNQATIVLETFQAAPYNAEITFSTDCNCFITTKESALTYETVVYLLEKKNLTVIDEDYFTE